MGPWCLHRMKTSRHEKTFRITGPLWEEFTGHLLFPLTGGQSCNALVFLLPLASKSVEQTVEFLVIWDDLAFIKHHSNRQ